MGTEKDKVLVAAVSAATSNVNLLTNDRIQALTGGHGMLNLAAIAAANCIAEEVMRGADIKVRFANVHSQPVDQILKNAIEAAMAFGADAGNAALLSATLLYLMGTQAQVGVPSGNRKLGAMARIIAKVDRCGVAAVPTGKMNNKISGFPAVQAVYQAIMNGELSPISGADVPQNVGGGPLMGHSALGEDIVFPAMATNGARIGTEAMKKALAGACMPVHPFTAALFGAAAILEIIHPDAALPPDHGPYHEHSSVYLAGKSAAETAGLPEKVHFKITGEEMETADLIGDLGLILKDVGGPTVIGMMALDEIVAAFQEGLAGFSGGPLNPPLGHILADAVVAFKALPAMEWNKAAVADALVELRQNISIDPEVALVSMNTIARKAAELRPGLITDTLIMASEPSRIKSLYQRAQKTWAGLEEGKSLAKVVQGLEEERQDVVEARANAMFSKMTGKEVNIHVTKMVPGARRKGRLVEDYIAFDPLADVDVTIDGETMHLEGVIHDLIPRVAKGERKDIAPIMPMVAVVLDEMTLMGNTIMNITVPAAVAAAMGKMSPDDAAKEAAANAPLTAGIPGARVRAEKVAALAAKIMA
jgi:predicted RNA binding protein with dsRBD fold (UPF0201 family)